MMLSPKSVTFSRRPNSDGFVLLNGLPDGMYQVQIFSMGTAPQFMSHQFQMLIENGTSSVSEVDAKTTTLHLTFNKAGKPFNQAQVKGKFRIKNGGHYDLIGQTAIDGTFIIALPEGIIDNIQAEKNGETIKKLGNLTLPPPASMPAGVSRPPKYIIIDADSSSFSSSINPSERDPRVVILGDMSGSMSSGNKMDILKRSFKEILDKCMKNNWKVSLAAWDTEILWWTQTVTWVTQNDRGVVEEWIMKLQHRGGNDMRNAISKSMECHPDATDVYVMCDGDITPFNQFEGGINWIHYRQAFPKTKFHFIALGTGASYEPMEEMAGIGGGTFTHST